MTTRGGAAPDDAAEAQWIAAALRAHVEWHAALGASGLPSGKASSGASIAPSPARRSGASDGDKEAPSVRAAPPSSVRAAGRVPTASQVEAQAPVVLPSPDESSRSVDASTEVAKRHLRLVALADEVRTCQKCVLSQGRTQTVFARGNPEAELCFVGEGPGAEEDARGEPFVGKAGQLLDRMIEAMGFARDDVYICNIVKCRPPDNRKPEPDEMSACLPYLTEQLALVRPKVIVALGATAVEGLLGATSGITRVRGQWKLYRGAIPVMPTFHPAYLLRNPAAKRDVWNDLKAVLKQLGRKVPVAAR